MVTPPNVMDGVEQDIAEITSTKPSLATCALAHAARALGMAMDSDPSATAMANCARELRATLDALRELAPAETKGGTLVALQNAAKRAPAA